MGEGFFVFSAFVLFFCVLLRLAFMYEKDYSQTFHILKYSFKFDQVSIFKNSSYFLFLNSLLKYLCTIYKFLEV